MQDFNETSALYAAVKANDVTKAEELLKAGAKPDSHMLAIALDDDFAIPQRKFSVGSDDMLMAHLLLRHGADVNGNNHEPIVAAFTKPNLLGMFVVMDQPGYDLKAALNSVKTLPQYKDAEYRRGEEFLGHFIRAQGELAKEHGFLPTRKGNAKPQGPQ